jgi:hypothetical protein
MKKEVPPFLYPSIIVKKSIIDEVGGFREFFDRKGFADFDWMSRISEQCSTLNVPKPLYYYRRHSDQFTQKKIKYNVFFSNIHLLVVQAHLNRLNSEEDFFETDNKKKMKGIIAAHYHKEAKRLFWENKKFKAIKILIAAIYLDNKNHFRRDLLYMLRRFLVPFYSK